MSQRDGAKKSGGTPRSHADSGDAHHDRLRTEPPRYDHDNAEGAVDEPQAAYAPKPSLAKRPSNDPVVLNNIAIHQANLEEGHAVASASLKLAAEDTLFISEIALPAS